MKVCLERGASCRAASTCRSSHILVIPDHRRNKKRLAFILCALLSCGNSSCLPAFHLCSLIYRVAPSAPATSTEAALSQLLTVDDIKASCTFKTTLMQVIYLTTDLLRTNQGYCSHFLIKPTAILYDIYISFQLETPH